MNAPSLEYARQVMAEEIASLKRDLRKVPAGSYRDQMQEHLESCEFVAALIEMHAQFNGMPVQ